MKSISSSCRRRCIGVASCVGTLALGGCGSLPSDSSFSAAQVRFVEVSPGAPEMDFYVNGAGAAYGVGYESYTSYLPTMPGTASLSVNRAGGTQAVTTTQATLSGGRQYTAILSHRSGGMQEHVFLDQDTPAAAGKIALRVLHEMEGSGPLTVHIAPATGSELAAPVAVWTMAPGAASSYVTLPAEGSYTVSASVADSEVSVPLTNVTVKASSGAVRTVVFAGTYTVLSHRGVVGFALADVDLP